ncbi:MAG: hypothetical protein GEU99_08665 [Luteitalea sp.]|nr:hypothetical protein [Luteitalea sp.]
MRTSCCNASHYLDALTRHSPRQFVARLWNRGAWRWHTRPLATAAGRTRGASGVACAELCRLASAATAAAAELHSRPGLLHVWHAPRAVPARDVEDQHNYQRFRLVARALARRYLIYNDRASLDRLQVRLRSWMSGHDQFVERSMEPMNISLRLREWLWVLLLLWNRLPLGTRDGVVSSMRRQKARLNRHVEYEVPGNHPIVNLFAIWMVEAFLESGAGSKRSRAVARRLETEAVNSFLPDHFHIELSTHYHLQMVRVLTEYVWLSAMIGNSVAPEFSDSLRKWTTVLFEVMLPDGRFPLIGDHCHSLFEESAAADVATVRALGGQGPETESSFWLKRLTHASRQVSATSPCERVRRVHLFEDAGYLVARDTPSPTPSVCWFDLGPLGFIRNPGHGHSDCLSILLYLRGAPFLIDPGVDRYDDQPDFLWFKTTAAHNTIGLAHHEPTEPWRFFRWTAMPPIPRRFFEERSTGFVAQGTFDGYLATARAEVTRRCAVDWSKRMIVIDEVRFLDVERDSLRVRWHLDPDWTLSLKGPGTVVASNGDDRVLVTIRARSSLRTEMRREPVARDYASTVPGPVLVGTVDRPGTLERIVSTFDWS